MSDIKHDQATPIDSDVPVTLLQKVAYSLGIGIGESGCVAIADTSPHGLASVVSYRSLVAITEVQFASVTGQGVTGFSNLILPAGTTIHGQFYTVTLTSGSVLAYLP